MMGPRWTRSTSARSSCAGSSRSPTRLTDFFSDKALTNITQHLLPGLWPLLVAFAVCVLAVPLAIRLSLRYGWIAQPGGRHAHANPTPLLGGLAMWVGFGVAVMVFVHATTQVVGVVVMSGLAMALLAIDDKRPMQPLVKLGVQLGLALVAVVVFGIEIRFFSLPGGHLIQLGLLMAPVSIFWLVSMQNTVNFLDGVDGLAAGVIAIVAVILMLAAGQLKQPDVVQLSGALAGCCAGFLIFNFHPARIFMGDSGAHFLGMALGMISILGVAKVAVAFALAAPVLALALPIIDTGWAILRRRRQGTSVARPDLMHLHHRLQAFGLDPRQTCYVFYAASALLGGLGLTLFGHGRILAVVLVATAVLTSTVAIDLLQHAGWRVPAPWLRRLLGVPGSQ
ncbi:MAG: undecaprenyl/decaprenyl-phosphate alpha-N-acetylglucosaminyl 1-phosphate transferase [Chloroflexi bacterium]|nr:MAG: undecaprenyl/decaprenyl-phosphate alpha-N-acetylglucosaminyl 1-phosphate transferase [Chloroflexota bacterium]